MPVGRAAGNRLKGPGRDTWWVTLRRDDPERENRLRPTAGRFWRALWFQAREWIDPRGWVALVGTVVLVILIVLKNLGVHW